MGNASEAVESGGFKGAVDEQGVVICRSYLNTVSVGWEIVDLRQTNAKEITPIAWKIPSLIHIISPPIFPLFSEGTVQPCVTTVKTITSILISANVLAFASFAISRYRDNG